MKEQSFTRRDFLQLAKYLTATAVASYFGIDQIDFEKVEQKHYPLPEWLNPGDRPVPKFFNTYDGHSTYIKTLARRSGVLRKTLSRVLENRYIKPPSHPPLLGDDYGEHVSIAEEELTRELGRKPNPSDSLRAASLTFAASAVLDPTEVARCLGAQYPKNPHQIDELQKQVMIATFPRVFPIHTNHEVLRKDIIYRFMGMDRYIHFSQHLAIVSELKHLHHAGLEDPDLMPAPIADCLKHYNPFGVPELNFSELAGRGWEAKESLEKPPWKVALLNSNFGVQSGAWDSFMTLDFAANRLGSFVGEASTGLSWGTNLGQMIEVMNDERVTRPIREQLYPEVNLDFARVLL